MLEHLSSTDTHQERVIIKVEDAAQADADLRTRGCEFLGTTTQEDIYLTQPEKEVLKLVVRQDERTLVRLHENEGVLDVVSEKPVSKEEHEQLITHYGERSRVHSTHNNYSYKDVAVTLITNEKGVFIALQADVIEKEVYEELGLKQP